MNTVPSAVQKACETVGSQSALARVADVPPAFVHQWLTGKRPVPANRCVSIEQATHGAVTRKDLRPNDWHLIWPELTNNLPTKDDAA
jgi:DNA-binding transcriptional regulator YdaS (Cro superfamily)